MCTKFPSDERRQVYNTVTKQGHTRYFLAAGRGARVEFMKV